jgi:hypothetical protein
MEISMSCERCQGTMVEDHLIDMEDSDGLMWITAWRCINCGHIVDPVMAANRQLLRTTALFPVVHEDLVHDSEQEKQPITRLAA